MNPIDVTIHLMFAFDIGSEIDLERAKALLPAEKGGLLRRRRTPSSIRYRPEPLRAVLPGEALALPAELSEGFPERSIRAELTVFDFGAISAVFQWSAALHLESLARIAGELAETDRLTAHARSALAPWIARLEPAVDQFEPSDLAEEYIVFQVKGGGDVAWLTEHAGFLAGVVRLESDPLGPEEVTEALRLRIAYTPKDLVVLDWAAGFVADDECADTLQVIEFANVQLLEFRHIDDRLDDRLEAAFRLIQEVNRRRWYLPARRARGEAARQVRELEIEAAGLFERADNALKLIGDQYLSRVFGIASARFHLEEWQQSIRRKLDAVGDVHDVLTNQDHSRRAELLETIVVILILIEIALALVRH